MVLELQWLAKSKLGPDPVRVDVPVEDISISRPEIKGLVNWETDQIIRSGYQIILTTTDIENHPLQD